MFRIATAASVAAVFAMTAPAAAAGLAKLEMQSDYPTGAWPWKVA